MEKNHKKSRMKYRKNIVINGRINVKEFFKERRKGLKKENITKKRIYRFVNVFHYF